MRASSSLARWAFSRAGSTMVVVDWMRAPLKPWRLSIIAASRLCAALFVLLGRNASRVASCACACATGAQTACGHQISANTQKDCCAQTVVQCITKSAGFKGVPAPLLTLLQRQSRQVQCDQAHLDEAAVADIHVVVVAADVYLCRVQHFIADKQLHRGAEVRMCQIPLS